MFTIGEIVYSMVAGGPAEPGAAHVQVLLAQPCQPAKILAGLGAWAVVWGSRANVDSRKTARPEWTADAED
jgi:hypothetical protein